MIFLIAGAAIGCAGVKGNELAGAGAASGSSGAGGATMVGPPTGKGGTGVVVPPLTCSHLNIGILGNPGSNSSSNFQTWLEARGTIVQRIQTTSDVPLTADALHPFDVVVIDLPPREYTPDEAAIFGAWVAAGGGVASMSGYHDDTSQDWRANSLLSQIGVAYSGDRIWGPVTQFAVHPITAGLTSVTFTGGYPVADLGGAGVRTPIAFIPSNGNQVAVAYAIEMGSGKAFVWGDEWIEFDSEWSSLPQIPKLWLQVFSWIAPANRCTLTGIG